LTTLPAAVASPPCNIVILVRPSSLPPRRAASIVQWKFPVRTAQFSTAARGAKAPGRGETLHMAN